MDTNTLKEKIISLSESNNVLIVATDSDSEHIATCTIPMQAFSKASPAYACGKISNWSALLDDAEDFRAAVSIIRYAPENYKGVFYSSVSMRNDDWKNVNPFRARKHVADAMAATKMWRAYPLLEHKHSMC